MGVRFGQSVVHRMLVSLVGVTLVAGAMGGVAAPSATAQTEGVESVGYAPAAVVRLDKWTSADGKVSCRWVPVTGRPKGEIRCWDRQTGFFVRWRGTIDRRPYDQNLQWGSREMTPSRVMVMPITAAQKGQFAGARVTRLTNFTSGPNGAFRCGYWPFLGVYCASKTGFADDCANAIGDCASQHPFEAYLRFKSGARFSYDHGYCLATWVWRSTAWRYFQAECG